MDKNNKKIKSFLQKSEKPTDEEIENFLASLKTENSQLTENEIESIRNRIQEYREQSKKLEEIEKNYQEYKNLDHPNIKELESILEDARNKKADLKDLSEEIKKAKKLLILIKLETAKEKKQEPSQAKPEQAVQVALEPEIKKSKKQVKGGKKKEEEKQKLPEKEQTKVFEEETKISKDLLMEKLGRDKEVLTALISDQLTPEKQAVAELLEEKLVKDLETRIKKLKERQQWLSQEIKPKGLVPKLKSIFKKEGVEIEEYDIDIHGPLVTFEGVEGYNEVERYWVNEPYAFVVILYDPEKNDYQYFLAEPKLTRFEDTLLREIKDRLKDVLLVEEISSNEDKTKILTKKVKELVKDYEIDATPLTLEKILYYTRRDFINYGKIDGFMHDNKLEDISANGHDIPVYLFHKKYHNIPTNVVFREDELDSFIIRLAQRCGKHISIAEPMIDATIPDGSRIQMTLGSEVTTRGGTFTIRKFSEIPITPIDLIMWKTFSAEEMAYLWLCIENNKSLIFAGGTASGKTSSLNAVSLFIPPQAKIVSLEDTRELKLPHPNWIPGITRDSFTADERGSIDMYELLRAALRQRPEYLLVGEVRGKEALTLFQAMSTGHTTFSTMHADSVASAIHRLENPPISVPRTMIQALNIISIQGQTFLNGKRVRKNLKLVEITDIDPNTRNIRTSDIFSWDSVNDAFNRVGESKALNEIKVQRGWSSEDLRGELLNRQKILEFMVNNTITDFDAISTIIHEYSVTPEKVLKKLKIQ